MALDFSVLQGMDPAGAFFRGQEAVRAEQDRNLLRQAQMEQMAAQRENMLAQRRTQEAEEARRREMFELDREVKTLDYATRSLNAATPETYSAIRANLTRINPQFGASLPQEYNEAQVKAIARQGLSVKEQIDAAMGRSRYMSTPYGPFDIESGQFKMPDALPSRAPAPGAAPTPAAPKPPVGYRFTNGGNLEPIPGGPAAARAAKGAVAPGGAAAVGTPAQQAKTEAQMRARQALSKDLETQLGYYQRLNEMGGMVSSTEGPSAANVGAFARASGPGQAIERALGTKAQTLRDNIRNTRQRLFMQIKDATGASAQQMNSNVEMQAWLNAMTDPQQSIETVRETLGQLDAVIASVKDQMARESRGKPAATPAAPSGRDLGGGFKLVD